MNRFNCDYGSRFRILKGGKISLVVSAMLLGVSLQAAYIQGDGSGGGGAGGKEQDTSLNYVTGGNGGGGNDTLDGTAVNDVIFGDGSGGGGGARLNSLELGTQSSGGTGGSGNDVINGGAGDDIIFGDGFHGTKSRALTIPFAHYLGGAGGLGGGGGGGNAGAQQQMGSTSKGGVLGGKGGEYGNLPGQYIAPTNSTPTSDTPSLTGQAGTSDDTNYYAGGGGGFGGGTLWAGDIYYGQGGKAGVYGAVQGDTAVHTYTGDSANYYTPILSLFKTSATNGQWLSPNLYGNTWEYGNGSDTLYGGPGFDILVGLGGNDTFEFRMSDIADDGNETDAIWDYSRYPLQSGTDTIKVYKNDGTTLFDAPSTWEKGTLTHNGTSWIFTLDSNGNSSRQTYIEDMGGGVTRTQYIVLVGVTPPPPTLTTINTLTGATQYQPKEITFTELANAADENSISGSVTAFIVKALSSGTLKIGTASDTATDFNATSNNEINATHKAFWTSTLNGDAVGAFSVVAKDNGGLESATPVDVNITVSAVTLFNAEVNTSSPSFEINASHGEEAAWEGYIELNNNAECSIGIGKHYYQTQTFIATQDASHTIDTATLNGFINEYNQISDNFMAVYEGVFDPSKPTANLAGCNDDIDYDNDILQARFTADLIEGTVYTMVFTSSMTEEYINATYDDWPNPISNITGEGSFTISPEVSLAYSLSGTVNGLSDGETLTLSGVGSADQTITSNGNFVFDTPLADAVDFNITISSTNLLNEFRSCEILNANGTVSGTNVNNITINCTEDINYAPVFGIGNGKKIVSIEDNLHYSLIDTKYDGISGKYIYLGSNGILKFNSEGELDTTFGVNGVVSVPVWTVNSLDIDSQGRIITVESNQIKRFDSNGTLDTSFGTEGVFTNTPRGESDAFTGIKVLSDNSVLMLGYSYNPTTHLPEAALIKVTSTGVLDSSFGTNGKIYFDVPESILEAFKKVIIDSNGNIYAIGSADSNKKILVVKYSSSGVIDTTFGTNGATYIDANPSDVDIMYDVVLQNDGKILITGAIGIPNINTTTGKTGVIRLNTDGTFDTDFGTNGIVALDNMPNQSEVGKGLAINSDGSILVTAEVPYNLSGFNLKGSFYVTKLTSNGAVDITFGTNGFYSDSILLPNNDYAYGFISKLFVSGSGDILGISHGFKTTETSYSTKPLLVNLSANGVADVNLGIESRVGSTVLYKEGESPVVLESSAYLYDRDLHGTNYGGVTVTLSRQGESNATDIFGAHGNLSFADGSVTLFDTIIGTVTNSDGNLTITFNSDANQSAVNEALSSITYENNATQLPSSVVIAWSVNDGNVEAQGSDGALNGEGNTTINIQRAPKFIGGNSATAVEDGSYTIKLDDFGTYSPIGSETEFSHIKITELPENGTLKNDGDELEIGDQISYSDIENGYLTFTPNTNLFGNSIDEFSYQIGGAYDSDWNMIYSQTYTMTLNVSGVNDAPSFKLSDGVDYISVSDIYTDNDEDNIMKLQSDNKMIVAGYIEDEDENWILQVQRINIDGTLDNSFGTNGKFTLDTLQNAWPKAVDVDKNGNIFIGGNYYDSDTNTRKMVLVKLNSDGTLANSFDGDGIVQIDFTLSNDILYALTIDNDGKIIVTGVTNDDEDNQNIAVARLNTDGTLDTSFNTTGQKEITISGWDYAKAVALDGDKIIIGGYGGGNSILKSLNNNGSDNIDFTYTPISDVRIFTIKTVNGGMYAAGINNDTYKPVYQIILSNGTNVMTEPYYGAFDGEGIVTDIASNSDNSKFYFSIFNEDSEDSIIYSSANDKYKTFTSGAGIYSSSTSVEVAADGTVFVGSFALDAEENYIHTITKLDPETLDIVQIGGESSLGQSVEHNRATPTVLDSDVLIKDYELNATSYSGAKINLAREGEANSEDLFSFTETVAVNGNILSIVKQT